MGSVCVCREGEKEVTSEQEWCTQHTQQPRTHPQVSLPQCSPHHIHGHSHGDLANISEWRVDCTLVAQLGGDHLCVQERERVLARAVQCD